MIEIGQIFRYACPTAFAALGELVGEKAGVINVGLEGLMLSSAFTGSMVALSTGNPWLGLMAGAATGILMCLLLGFFAITLRQDQIVVGTALNLLALGVTGTLYEQRFGKSGSLFSVPALPTYKLPMPLGSIDLVTIMAVLVVVILGWALKRTAWGLALRGGGEYPKAVDAAGFSVQKIRYSALIVAGFLGGIGGAYYSLGIANSFAPTAIAGRGFVAIAMVTFGKWRPFWIVVGCLMIGLAERLQFDIQALGWKIPLQALLALPYLLTLFVLLFVGKGALAPKALGQAYPPSK